MDGAGTVDELDKVLNPGMDLVSWTNAANGDDPLQLPPPSSVRPTEGKAAAERRNRFYCFRSRSSFGTWLRAEEKNADQGPPAEPPDDGTGRSFPYAVNARTGNRYWQCDCSFE